MFLLCDRTQTLESTDVSYIKSSARMAVTSFSFGATQNKFA